MSPENSLLSDLKTVIRIYPDPDPPKSGEYTQLEYEEYITKFIKFMGRQFHPSNHFSWIFLDIKAFLQLSDCDFLFF